MRSMMRLRRGCLQVGEAEMTCCEYSFSKQASFVKYAIRLEGDVIRYNAAVHN